MIANTTFTTSTARKPTDTATVQFRPNPFSPSSYLKESDSFAGDRR